MSSRISSSHVWNARSVECMLRFSRGAAKIAYLNRTNLTGHVAKANADRKCHASKDAQIRATDGVCHRTNLYSRQRRSLRKLAFYVTGVFFDDRNQLANSLRDGNRLHVVTALDQCIGDLCIGKGKRLAFFVGLRFFDVLGPVVENSNVQFLIHAVLFRSNTLMFLFMYEVAGRDAIQR